MEGLGFSARNSPTGDGIMLAILAGLLLLAVGVYFYARRRFLNRPC